MVPFNNDSTPDNTLCIDGLNFSINEPFLLISNKPIPKHGKVYMEFEVKTYTQITGKRNIPIYAGIHKEPAFGVLNSDFCIGSLFYTEGKDFDIIEKYNKDAIDKHSVPSKIYSKIPGATDTIGIGVDYDNNLISFYNNGKPFYSFSPSLFNIKDESDFYFCIWGNISCGMKGSVNFGKNGVEYLPIGYTTAYGAYYRRSESISDILCDIQVEKTIEGSMSSDIDCYLNVTNDIMGDGSIYLESTKAILSKNNKTYTINHQDSYNYLNDGANVFVNLPIPTDQKVYVEFEVKDGICSTNIVGIPASFGISNSKKTIQSKSMRMPLYHNIRHKYTYTEVKNLMPIVNQIEDVLTTIPPTEGNTIGLAIDLANNSITILLDNVRLYTFTAKENDFRDKDTLYYLFLHDEGMFGNYITGDFNSGETKFAATMPSGYISLFDYYNNFYALPVEADISCDIMVTPYYLTKDVYIHGDITVLEPLTPDESKFSKPGVNKLMKTYNVVNDRESHVIIDNDIIYLNKVIADNNNGFFPDDKF